MPGQSKIRTVNLDFELEVDPNVPVDLEAFSGLVLEFNPDLHLPSNCTINLNWNLTL